MNIVVLDKLNIPERYVERLRRIGEVRMYDDVPAPDDVLARLRHAHVSVSKWTGIGRDVLEQARELQFIALASTGYDLVDVVAARERGIAVSNVPGYSRQAVAEYVFALALAVMRHVPAADACVRAGNAAIPPPSLQGLELYGKTLGVIGLGSIGSWVARIGGGFGMRVLGCSRTPKDLPGVEQVDLDLLLEQSDVVAVCVDVNASSIGLLNRERMQRMKRGATLVNISTSQVLDETALADLLDSGQLAGAALDDVAHAAPDDTDAAAVERLIASPHVVLSARAGWYTHEAELRLIETVVENIEAFVKGRPQHLVT